MNTPRRVPLLKLRHTYTPSSDLADIQLGELFNHANGRSYMLLSRNPWTATIIRYTRWDAFASRIAVWVRDRFKR